MSSSSLNSSVVGSAVSPVKQLLNLSMISAVSRKMSEFSAFCSQSMDEQMLDGFLQNGIECLCHPANGILDVDVPG